MKVKVCGITNKEDVLRLVYYGVHALGFIFHKKSPRYVSPSRAKKIIEELPPFVSPVGVFVDSSQRAINDICRFTKINTIQLHGNETPEFCKRMNKVYYVIKAFRVGFDFDVRIVKKYECMAYLFDTYKEGVDGGTGETFNWDILTGCEFDKPFILSGGLQSDNIQDAIKKVKPYAVDVSSGLEKSPGIKNPRKVRAFFDIISQESN